MLKLYRDIFRTSYKMPDETHRKEIQKWARDDFKKNKHHTDEVCGYTLFK